MGMNERPKMTYNTIYSDELPITEGTIMAENKDEFFVTTHGFYPEAGLYEVEITTNDIKILRAQLNKLVVYYNHPRESEAYGNV